MAKLIDYKCRYSDYKGVSQEYANSLGVKIPDLYLKAEDMIVLSLAQKKERGATFCKLPFDTAVQAENIGAIINYDTSPLGPRKLEDAIEEVKEVLDLPDFDPTKGRVGEILKAARFLMDKGETVAMEIRGFYDTMNSLIDIQKVFMEAAMSPDIMRQACDKIRGDVVAYFLAVEKTGCKVIFYSDSSGGMNVIGPKFTKKMVDWFTYPLMQDLSTALGPDTLVHLCPKVAFMLVGCDKATWQKEATAPENDYLQAYISSDTARFTGQRCNRNLNHNAGGQFHYLELK